MDQVSRGADPGVLGPYLTAQLNDGSWEPLEVELLSGGKSNLTYLLRARDREAVLRRPPLGHVLPTAHDMVREYTVLEALHPTEVPVPRPLHLCTDLDVIGVPFFVMERLVGHIVRGELPTGYAEEPEDRKAIGEAVVDNLVAVHAVDWKAVGLETFGRPEGFMGRQVARWSDQWKRSVTRDIPAMKELISRLHESLPDSPGPSIVHGDYRVDNLVLDPDRPGSIVGTLDWEMSTIGDPLADLGLLLTYWPQSDDSDLFRQAIGGITVTTKAGFPNRSAVVARYADGSGRAVDSIIYYWAFGFFKLAVILEGIHARYLEGKTLGGGFQEVGYRVVPLVTLGLRVLDRGGLGPL